MFESFAFKFNYSEKQNILLPNGIFTIHSVRLIFIIVEVISTHNFYMKKLT